MAASCSVLVDCYNYERFVGEAIDSALKQTLAPLEVIVVDDGSTDETPKILQAKYGENPAVKIIRQRNGGQGMALVAALERAEGDLVFLLDADDKYEPDHLEKVAAAFAANRYVDYIFTAHRKFGAADDVVRHFPADRLVEMSIIAAMLRLHYVGTICSCLALRRNLGLTLLPVLRQVAPRWRVSGDDLFNYGSSIAGARKLYLAEPTVLYRMHETNASHETLSKWVNMHWLLRSNLVAVCCDHFGVRPEIAHRADVEFSLIESPTPDEYEMYRSIAWDLKLPLWQRIKMLRRMRLHFKAGHCAER